MEHAKGLIKGNHAVFKVLAAAVVLLDVQAHVHPVLGPEAEDRTSVGADFGVRRLDHLSPKSPVEVVHSNCVERSQVQCVGL